jgi:rubrerythrin
MARRAPGDADGPAGTTRAHALRAAVAGGVAVGAGALAGGWLRPPATAGQPSRAQDVRIFNVLLVLEEAQAAFYDATLRAGKLGGDLLAFARTVAPQEREHVAFVQRLLGRSAARPPAFRFGDATSNPAHFQATAIELEEAAVATYIGQGANLTRPSARDAARIVAVEARHAAWIRDLAGAEPAPHAADPPRDAADVLADLRRKGILR